MLHPPHPSPGPPRCAPCRPGHATAVPARSHVRDVTDVLMSLTSRTCSAPDPVLQWLESTVPRTRARATDTAAEHGRAGPTAEEWPCNRTSRTWGPSTI